MHPQNVTRLPKVPKFPAANVVLVLHDRIPYKSIRNFTPIRGAKFSRRSVAKLWNNSTACSPVPNNPKIGGEHY